MKIRLHGTEPDCRQAIAVLARVLAVTSVSRPYPDRGASVLVRVYVDAAAAGGLPPAPSVPRPVPGLLPHLSLNGDPR
jgi:hypothetical protein